MRPFLHAIVTLAVVFWAEGLRPAADKTDTKAELRGRVVCDGDPVPGAKIDVPANGEWTTTVTDDKGRFSVSGLPKNTRWRVGVSKQPKGDWMTLVASIVVEIPPGQQIVDLGDIPVGCIPDETSDILWFASPRPLRGPAILLSVSPTYSGDVDISALFRQLHPQKREMPPDGARNTPIFTDRRLQEAVGALKKEYPAPWSLQNVLKWYRKAKDAPTRKHWLSVLAASRHPKAAIELGNAIEDRSLMAGGEAIDGLLYHFATPLVVGGSEQQFEAAFKWWKANKDRLLAEVEVDGWWRVISAQREGKPDQSDAAWGPLLCFRHERLIINALVNARHKLSCENSTKQIDITVRHGDATEVYRGIYRVEGDNLTMCLGLPGRRQGQTSTSAGERPADFTADKGQQRALYVLKRLRPEEGQLKLLSANVSPVGVVGHRGFSDEQGRTIMHVYYKEGRSWPLGGNFRMHGPWPEEELVVHSVVLYRYRDGWTAEYYGRDMQLDRVAHR